MNVLEDKSLTEGGMFMEASRVSILGILSSLMPHQVQDNLIKNLGPPTEQKMFYWE